MSPQEETWDFASPECTALHSERATHYTDEPPNLFSMGNPLHPLAREAQSAFSDNVKAAIDVREMKAARLADRGDKNKKTVYNVLALGHPAKLESLAKIAEKLDIPLWMLMIPGLAEHRDLLKPGALKPLKAIVDNYLNTSPGRRDDIEECARVCARLSNSRGSTP